MRNLASSDIPTPDLAATPPFTPTLDLPFTPAFTRTVAPTLTATVAVTTTQDITAKVTPTATSAPPGDGGEHKTKDNKVNVKFPRGAVTEHGRVKVKPQKTPEQIRGKALALQLAWLFRRQCEPFGKARGCVGTLPTPRTFTDQYSGFSYP